MGGGVWPARRAAGAGGDGAVWAEADTAVAVKAVARPSIRKDLWKRRIGRRPWVNNAVLR
jgi:hypothetical protein